MVAIIKNEQGNLELKLNGFLISGNESQVIGGSLIYNHVDGDAGVNMGLGAEVDGNAGVNVGGIYAGVKGDAGVNVGGIYAGVKGDAGVNVGGIIAIVGVNAGVNVGLGAEVENLNDYTLEQACGKFGKYLPNFLKDVALPAFNIGFITNTRKVKNGYALGLFNNIKEDKGDYIAIGLLNRITSDNEKTKYRLGLSGKVSIDGIFKHKQ